MKRLSWMLAASALMVAPAIARADVDNDQNADTDTPSQTQTQSQAQTKAQTQQQNDPWADTENQPNQNQNQNQNPSSQYNQYNQRMQQSDQLDQFGHARLGVRVMNLTPDLRQYFAVPGSSGLLVATVTEDSPAARAGLKAGDVILSVDGQPVSSASDVRDVLSNVNTGDKIKIDIIRDKKQKTLTTSVLSTNANASLDFMHQVMPWFDPNQLETPT